MFKKSILFSPLLFYIIKGHTILSWYKYYIPLGITILLVGYGVIYASSYPVSCKEIVKNILIFLQLVPGFYITALATIATMNKKLLEEPTIPELTLESYENGLLKTRVLTRRRFLCFLLGYLCYLSIVLLVSSIIGINLNPIYFLKEYSTIYIIGKICCMFIFVFFFSQLLLLTFLGLHYLSIILQTKKTVLVYDDKK